MINNTIINSMSFEKNDVLDNENYRKFLYTSERLQLVTMSLKPLEEIPPNDEGPFEIHKVDQFFLIAKGEAEFIIAKNKDEIKGYKLSKGDFIVVPAGNYHNVKNSSKKEKLKILTIYAPRQHY